MRIQVGERRPRKIAIELKRIEREGSDMRVLDVREDHVDDDIREGRRIMNAEIDHPSMSVIIIRGNSPRSSRFVDNASARCDPFPWRSGVWVRNEQIFTSKAKAWFNGHADSCAVILDLNDEPASWLAEDAELFDIEQAWLQAEGRS